ncbi:MAG: heavy-metal-associated domain-containing protein [Burkholderiaceae bacterium]|jgi:copper chaperone CopZ|nr:heavy-metal-associated domain-containing protein [Burkholderiaceae bacterium]
METIEIKVEGMTCGSCVASVTKALAHVPGVHDVKVDLRSGVARISGTDVSQQVPALVAALGEAGYLAHAPAAAPDPHGQRAGDCHPGTAARSGGGCCCN